jgi:hypothetical protein
MDSAEKKGTRSLKREVTKGSSQRRRRQMKKYLLLLALLCTLNGCAFGVYDGHSGFHGAVIGVPYADLKQLQKTKLDISET